MASSAHVIDYAPHDGQKLFHKSRARYRIMACGARFGKDRCSVNELIKLTIQLWQQRRGKNNTLTPLVHVWIVAPTYDLARQNWRELTHFMPPQLVEKNSQGLMRMDLPDGVLIEARSASRPESLVSTGIDIVLVTEAGMIPALAWEQSIQPRLISPGRAGFAIINGTPKGTHSWFHSLYMQGQDPLQPHIDSWNFPTLANPHIDPAEVEQLRSTMPDRWFRQEILAEWLDDAGGVFRNVRNRAIGLLKPPVPDHDYVMGVDLAKVHDFSVLTVTDVMTREVVAWERFKEVDWNTQKRRVANLSKVYNDATILLDSTGLGDPILEDLQDAGLPVEGFVFSRTSKKAIIDALAIAFEQDEITIPDIPQLINELQAYEYTVTPGGTIQMSAPTGFYDDCVISLALSWWHCTRAPRYGLRTIEPHGRRTPSGIILPTHQDIFAAQRQHSRRTTHW